MDANGNIYTLGFFQGGAAFAGRAYAGSIAGNNLFLCKIDSRGVELWAKVMTLTSILTVVEGYGLAVDSNGDVIITGRFATYNGAYSFGGSARSATSNGTSIFVIKYDAAGNYLWDRVYGTSSGFAVAKSVLCDAANNIYFTGTASGTTDFGNGPVSATADDTVVLVKLTATGGHLRSQSFGAFGTYGSYAAKDSGGQAISLAPNGDVVLAGNFRTVIDFGGGALRTDSANNADIFFARLNESGAYIWQKQISGGNNDHDVALGADVDANNNMVFAGGVFGDADFGLGNQHTSAYESIFVCKYSSVGACLWAKTFGGNQAANGVAVDVDGHVFSAGYVGAGLVDFGGGTVLGPTSFILSQEP